MVATLSSSPYQTTVTAGTFNTQSKGLVQGDVYPDPAIRYKRAGGVLAESETIPMWGGVALYVEVPGGAYPSPNIALGATVGRATTNTGGSKPILGFSVFEGAYAMVNRPSSPVPLIGSYGPVQYYRLGSGARVIVACSPNLVNLEGELINAQVSWDFANQQLEPYTSTTISSGTYNSTTGAVSLTTAAAHGLNPGDTFELSSLTATGGGAGNIGQLDGEWTATAGTTAETLNYTGPTTLGSITITGGTLGSGGAIAVDVLEVQAGNCMTVEYNSGSGLATWNYNGNCAVILI